METFKVACQITKIHFARWKKEYRIWFIFLVTALLIHRYLQPLVAFCEKMNCTATIYMLTMFFDTTGIGTGSPKLTMYIGLILLLCDAPFMTQVVPYAVVRSRRKSWFLGNCFYIVSVSLIYITFVSIVSSLCVLPYAVIGDNWGSAYEGLTYGMIYENRYYSELEVYTLVGRNIPFQDEAVKYLYPQASFLYTFFSVWATFTILGFVIYMCSLIKKNAIIGVSIAGAVIFLEPIIIFARKESLYPFSIVSWTSLCCLDVTSQFNQLSIPIVIVACCVLIALLVIVSWRLSRKKMIEQS